MRISPVPVPCSRSRFAWTCQEALGKTSTPTKVADEAWGKRPVRNGHNKVPRWQLLIWVGLCPPNPMGEKRHRFLSFAHFFIHGQWLLVHTPFLDKSQILLSDQLRLRMIPGVQKSVRFQGTSHGCWEERDFELLLPKMSSCCEKQINIWQYVKTLYPWWTSK